jgi:hypothetical protein
MKDLILTSIITLALATGMIFGAVKFTRYTKTNVTLAVTSIIMSQAQASTNGQK